MAARSIKTLVPFGNSKEVAVYASPRVAQALQELTEDMSLYHGVRLAQLLEAVYKQGHKDGAKTALDRWQESLSAAQKAIPHNNPGRPRGNRTPKKSRRRRSSRRGV